MTCTIIYYIDITYYTFKHAVHTSTQTQTQTPTKTKTHTQTQTQTQTHTFTHSHTHRRSGDQTSTTLPDTAAEFSKAASRSS